MSAIPRFGILPLAIIAAMGVGAVAGVAFLNLSQPGAQAPAEATPAARSAAHGAMLKLPDRVVNLADAGGRRYLKVGVTLEIESKDPKEAKEIAKLEGEALLKKEEAIKKQLEPTFPKINDILTTVLSAKTFEQIATSDGKTKVKEELKHEIGTVLTKDNIIEIYFTEFVVQ